MSRHFLYTRKEKNVKVCSSSWETILRATGRNLPDGVTCHPTQVNARLALTPTSKLILNLPIPEGWKAMHRPGTELAISRLQVWRPNNYTTEPKLEKKIAAIRNFARIMNDNKHAHVNCNAGDRQSRIFYKNIVCMSSTCISLWNTPRGRRCTVWVKKNTRADFYPLILFANYGPILTISSCNSQ